MMDLSHRRYEINLFIQTLSRDDLIFFATELSNIILDKIPEVGFMNLQLAMIKTNLNEGINSEANAEQFKKEYECTWGEIIPFDNKYIKAWNELSSEDKIKIQDGLEGDEKE
jgi:hypothetical protein